MPTRTSPTKASKWMPNRNPTHTCAKLHDEHVLPFHASCADFNGRGIPPWGLKQWEGVRLLVVREVSHELRFLVAVINEAKP